MTWLLIVMLGTSISSSTVSWAQCNAALKATSNMGLAYRVPAVAVCIGPQGQVVRSGGQAA